MNQNEYKWDLESLLENKTLDDLFNEWVQSENELIQHYPMFLENINNFKKWIKLNEKNELISNRLMNYISNSINENLADPYFIGWSQKLQAKSTEFSTIFSDYDNILIKNKDKINEYLKDSELVDYQLMFDRVFKNKDYLLDEKTEKALSQLSAYNSGFDDIFSTLTDSDLKFKDAINSKGKKVPIKTQADVVKNLKNHDRELRKSTWFSFNEAFNSIQDTLTKTLYYNYLMLNSNAKIRGFKDYISATAFADEVDVEFIKFVYSNIKKFKSNNLEYAKYHSNILKSLFKLDKINPWDSSLELTKQNISYTIDQAKQEVLEALKILGKQYTDKIQEAFDKRWISWMPSPGKQTGAYSIGNTKGLTKYFISMNFDETIRSVYTLIHELGHSMNSFYTDTNQKIYDGTSIFYAEVASITNEMLLNYHLLNKYKDNKKIQLMIYDEMLSNFFATTTRQVIFSDFEFRANQLINDSQPFTAKSLKKIYQECCNEYSSISIKNNKLLDIALITPLRIPHFYVGNFYVYKYAIGQIAAILIAHEINQNNSAREKLFNFLSSGSSKTPIETIKLLGVDLTTEQPWDKANEIIKSWLNEYKKIAKELKYIK